MRIRIVNDTLMRYIKMTILRAAEHEVRSQPEYALSREAVLYRSVSATYAELMACIAARAINSRRNAEAGVRASVQ